MAKYILRLDDACHTMDLSKWSRVESILDNYNIRPIVAVVPNNKDKKLLIDTYDKEFWTKVTSWELKEWTIALHGFEHKYITKCSGYLPFNKKSEFAGLLLEEQKRRIKCGVQIFNDNNFEPRIWVAPSHTFDHDTLIALKEHSKVVVISDGISYRPYKYLGFIWVPQQLWKYHWMPFGVWTICLHPNSMSEKAIENLENMLRKKHKKFVHIDYVLEHVGHKSILDSIFQFAYRVVFFLKKLGELI
ncbi:MAG: DUF2334 domain-containing protein [Pseudomonadales bacterium]|nr:DUF2334 domain-containing protein [Pseudomonadales bacterium]